MTSLDRQSTKLIGYKFNFKDRFDLIRKVMSLVTVISRRYLVPLKLYITIFNSFKMFQNPQRTRAMKISWILVLLQYANLVESKAKPRLDQTSEFTTFFLKKWHKLVKNEKLNNWDEEKTGKMFDRKHPC